MPEIGTIIPVTYSGAWPYHFHYDNIPLNNILDRIDLVNFQVDINADILRNSIGSAGNLAARLDTSLEDSGDLKTLAVDASLHNIGRHEDGTRDDGVGGATISYVRMTLSERDKISLIESEANDLDIQVQSISTTELLTSGVARFKHSDTITFSLESPDIIKAHTVFPVAAAHVHYYDREPAHNNPSSPNYTNYKTTSVGTAFIADTLRVYVNGIRLSEHESVYVYNGLTGPDGTWTLTSVASSSPTTGVFVLNRALTASDVIRIDWDSDYS
jgi:hypothetical protein